MERKFSYEELAAMNPKEFRSIVRRGEFVGTTEAACRGYAQGNLAILPKDWAFEFLLFAQRNPRPCALLDITEPGDPHPKLVAPEADLRTDLPKYRVWRDGKLVDEPTDITAYWRDDLVAFLIGCSLSFDWSLRASNVKFRLVGIYTSNIECRPAGRLHGHVVVSCRLVKNGHDAIRAVQVSSRQTATHGPPVHIGDPALIGIPDVHKPDIWLPPEEAGKLQKPDEIALFWGCGVTPQKIAVESKVPFMITHSPSYMFVTDRLSEELAIL